MATPTSDFEDEATFLSSVDENEKAAAEGFWSWYRWYLGPPAQYNPNRVGASKWQNDSNGNAVGSYATPGTSGGVVTYSLATNASFSASEKSAIAADFSLWSDIADIKFKDVASSDSSNIGISRDANQGNYGAPSAHGAVRPGSDTIAIDTTSGKTITDALGNTIEYSQSRVNLDLQNIGSFTSNNGYSVWASLHEIGHALGLGHGGPYDGGAAGADGFSPLQVQYTQYDNWQYSIMSYIQPDNPDAKYYNSYDVKGTNWNGVAPQTPMMADIAAIQRLYGASKTATFAGNQTYGFNTTISGGSRRFYDFNTNINPVVTIYSTGINNTLDLSGFSSSSIINLNPGTFSSASNTGMTNNIGIDYHTRVDRAIGGIGDDTFLTNGNGDTIDGGAGRNVAVLAGSKSDYAISWSDASHAVATNTATGTRDTLNNIQEVRYAGVPVCFTTGTLIRVLRNAIAVDVPVEALRTGDIAVTSTGGQRSIRWIGSRMTIPREQHLPSQHWPVRILAGAFGTDRVGVPLPARDLRLSPGHPVLVGADATGAGGVLVPIMCLINGTSIVQTQVDCVVYWHIELDRHDLLLAENLPAESYFECGMRGWFDEDLPDSDLADLECAGPSIAGRCRPVTVEGPEVVAARQHLNLLFQSCLVGQCVWPEAEDMIRFRNLDGI